MFPFWCNKTKTARTEVINEPTVASQPELFVGEYYFCQDKLYYLSPFKSVRCGIPSLHHFGKRTKATINRT